MGGALKEHLPFPGSLVGIACSQCYVDYVDGQTSCCKNYMLQKQFEFQSLPKVHRPVGVLTHICTTYTP